MSVAPADEYVCPRCGAPAAGNSVCAACAEDLDAFETLPVRSEYDGGTAVAARRRPRSQRPALAPPLRKAAQALRDHPEIAGVVIGLVPLLSLSLTWFEFEGPFFLMFGDDGDPWLTAWEAFGWQDIVLAVIAVAPAAATVAQRHIAMPQALPLGIAVLGAALAVAMIASPPPVSPQQRNYSGGQYASTGWAWLAVAGFAVAALVHARGLTRAHRHAPKRRKPPWREDGFR